MTLKEYAAIQRELRFIEGVILNDDKFDGVLSAVEVIDDICKKSVSEFNQEAEQ